MSILASHFVTSALSLFSPVSAHLYVSVLNPHDKSDYNSTKLTKLTTAYFPFAPKNILRLLVDCIS